MSFEINIDVESIVSELKHMEQEVRSAIDQGVKYLAVSTHAHVLEQAAQKLHSRLKMFQDNLQFKEEESLYSIIIPDKIAWIEEGKPAMDLHDTLLKSPKAKMGKNGKYLNVPFEHGKPPTQSTAMQNSITGIMRQKLKERGIPYKKLETDASGAIRTGRLHTLNLGGPQRGATEINPAWKTPALQGLNIHQRADAQGKIQRGFTTFRTISEGGDGWNVPAIEGTHFLEEAYGWAQSEWSDKILPDIMDRFKR